MSNYMPGPTWGMAPWEEEDDEEADGDEMACPCPCPKCGRIHELSSAKKCAMCDGMFCSWCMDSLASNVCINCADEMESDTL